MFARILNGLEEGIISLLLVAMTLLVFVEVVLRFGYSFGYSFGVSTSFFLWVEELTLHMSAWMVLFGASYGVKVGSHIGVDAVVRLLSPGVRRMATLVAIGLCLVYCGLFMYGAWVYLDKIQRIGIELEDIAIQKWIAHSILFIGFVLLGIRFLQLGWLVFKGEVDGFRHADEAKEALSHLEEERRHAHSEDVGGGDKR